MAGSDLDAAHFRAWLQRALVEISRSRERLNRENLFPVADGDTGSNIEATLRAAVDAIAGGNSSDLRAISHSAAQGALHGAQGNSGVLVSQILRGFAEGLERDLAAAFSAAYERAEQALTQPLEGTLLSVARAARDGATEIAAQMPSTTELLTAAWRRAREATLESALHPPSESARGTLDAGAHGLELIYRSLVLVMESNKEVIDDIPKNAQEDGQNAQYGKKNPSINGDGEYEVMFELSNVSEQEIKVLRQELSVIGESLLIVGDERFWKIHVHTDFADACVEWGRKFTTPENIQITSLTNNICPRQRILITVANGPGFRELMADSGVYVIDAFNSRRVSAQEWITAAGSSHEVILIPHDLRGYESALEALKILEAREGEVLASAIYSRSPLQALAAISSHSENAASDFLEEVAAMENAAKNTLSITIATAPRNMEDSNQIISSGTFIALMDRQVISHGEAIIEVSYQALMSVIRSSTHLITLVTGANTDNQLALRVAERIKGSFPQLEIVSYFGGQAWYPLLMGIE